MTSRPHWTPGSDDFVSFIVMATPMLAWILLAGSRGVAELLVVLAGVGGGFLLKHLVRVGMEEIALLPAAVALLIEACTIPLTVDGVVLAAAAGIGLLVWAGSEPASGSPWRQQLEPALVPALGVAVALAVMFFLPSGTGGQVGLAALVLVGALALSAWLYLQSAAEIEVSQPTS